MPLSLYELIKKKFDSFANDFKKHQSREPLVFYPRLCIRKF